MLKIRVGVLRGGPSNEHEISLKTGENVLNNLPEDKYEGVDVVLNKDGQLFANNSPIKIQQLNYWIDIIFNALHGFFGEDGKVQQILDSAQIPYTGSGPLASALGMNKLLSRDIFQKAGLKIPRAIIIKEGESPEQAALKIFQSMNPYWVVKPASGGSSIGVSIAGDFGSLVSAIEKAFNLDPTILVEEYIKGREVTCGIIDEFRGEEHYALPIIEIIPPDGHEFFDYEVKYDGSTREICPADFPLSVKKEVEEIARQAHCSLGCEGYSRADMIVSSRGIFLLETNTLPGQTIASLIPKSASAIGLDFPNLLDHLIELALNRKRF